MNSKQIRSSAMLFLTALIWGLAFVAQDIGMDYVGPFTFNAVRNLLGGFVLIPVIYVLGKGKENRKRSVHEKESKKTVIVGGICCGIALFIGSTLQQMGILYTSVGKAGFITALYIIIVPVLGIFLHKKVGWKIWSSVVVALIGMYLLCVTEGFSVNKGDLLILICAVTFSFHILLIDYFSPNVNGVTMSCIQFFVCAILSTIGMLVFEEPSMANILAAWKPIAYAGFLSCGVAYTLQIVAQKNINPVVASLILSLESVFAALFGWWFLSQILEPKEVAGCVMVFAAIIVAQLPSKKN